MHHRNSRSGRRSWQRGVAALCALVRAARLSQALNIYASQVIARLRAMAPVRAAPSRAPGRFTCPSLCMRAACALPSTIHSSGVQRVQHLRSFTNWLCTLGHALVAVAFTLSVTGTFRAHSPVAHTCTGHRSLAGLQQYDQCICTVDTLPSPRLLELLTAHARPSVSWFVLNAFPCPWPLCIHRTCHKSAHVHDSACLRGALRLGGLSCSNRRILQRF